MHIADVLSVPDKDALSIPFCLHCNRWEYPFFVASDTASHCLPLAVVDPAYAQKQLDLMTK